MEKDGIFRKADSRLSCAIPGKVISGNHFQADGGGTIKMTFRNVFIEHQTFRIYIAFQ